MRPGGEERPESHPIRGRLGPAVLLAAYALLLGRLFEPAIFTPDANGYFSQGARLANTGRLSFTLDAPVQYVGIHWLRAPSGEYRSRYPAGLALPIALLYRAFGPEAAVVLNAVLAWLAVLGTGQLGRRLAGAGWGWASAALLALNPTFLRHALACDSHMAVTVLLVWGLVLLARWGEHGRTWEAAGAGLLAGCIPTVRYPESLYAAGIAAFLLAHVARDRRRWKGALAAATAALVPIVPLLFYNHRAFGAFWRTAYAWTNEQTGFGWSYFRLHFGQYLRFLLGDGLGFLAAPGLFGLARWCVRRDTRPLGLATTLIVVPTLLLYMAYYWAPSQAAQGSLRFLLPLFPVLLIAAADALRAGMASWPRPARIAAAAALLTLQLAWGAPLAAASVRILRHNKRVLHLATAALREAAPAGSVVLASPRFLQHLDYVQEWRLADPTLARPDRGRDVLEGVEDDDTPRPQQAGKRGFQTARYEGLSPLEREAAFAGDVLEWAAGRPIFFAGTPAELAALRGVRLHADNLVVVKRVDMPSAPPPPDAGRPGRTPFTPRPGASAAAPSDPRAAPLRRMRATGAGDVLGGETEWIITKWDPRHRRWPAARPPPPALPPPF